MPKRISSPARPSDSSTGLRNHHRPRHRRNSSSRIGAGNGHGSPLLWAKTRPDHNSDMSEPTSPKVTCAGQIKVRAKPNQCKNWQSVMEEIERIHNHRKQKKRSGWIEALGFKKDVMQFLTCLRNLRFDFHCFGAFPSPGITSDDEDNDDDGDYESRNCRSREEETDHNSNDVFSKWFMILQENQGPEFADKEETTGKNVTPHLADDDCLPPPNALLLMRCRSTPAKKRREETVKEEAEKQEPPVMDYGSDFPQISADIAKETWIVGGMKEVLSRSRSWKR